jgi:hypothetical protein
MAMAGSPQLGDRPPQRRVEPEGLGGADDRRRRFLLEEIAQCLAQCPLLVGEVQVHRWFPSSPG